MQDKITIACVQMQSGISAAENIAASVAYIRQARAQGADMVSLPEMVNLMQIDKAQAVNKTYSQAEDPGLRTYGAVAKELGIWLHVGSMVLKNDTANGAGDKDGKAFVNRGFMLNPQGAIAATYTKLHMFDVDLQGGESYRESDAFAAGHHAVMAKTPWGAVGMSICYDVRFPYLYRALAQKGARILLVPAAFTRTTGAKHWHHLLRARAIECGAWVVAANQGADHQDGRQSYGHSLIINPDGVIIADGEMRPGVHLAEADLSLSDVARRQIPSLMHDNIPSEVRLS